MKYKIRVFNIPKLEGINKAKIKVLSSVFMVIRYINFELQKKDISKIIIEVKKSNTNAL